MIAFATSGGTDPLFLATWPMDYNRTIATPTNLNSLPTAQFQSVKNSSARLHRIRGKSPNGKTHLSMCCLHAEQNNADASKPVARHFNLPNHSHHNMTICGLSLHHGNTESRKNREQKLIFQLGTLSPHGINQRLSFH